MTTDIILTLVLGGLVAAASVALCIWLVRRLARYVLAFTVFMVGLPLVVSIPVFVLFPPAFLCFLLGLLLPLLGGFDENGLWRSHWSLRRIQGRKEAQREAIQETLGYR